MPMSRAAAQHATPIGFTARASWLTSLPSVSPKPPGSMKSRCMSMMTSAVVDQSSAIGSGSAMMVPRCAWLEFIMPHAPRRRTLVNEFCKRHAIVYNAQRSDARFGISRVFSRFAGEAAAAYSLCETTACSFAERTLHASAAISRANERRSRCRSGEHEADRVSIEKACGQYRALKAACRLAGRDHDNSSGAAMPCSPARASDIDIGGPCFSTCAPLRSAACRDACPPKKTDGSNEMTLMQVGLDDKYRLDAKRIYLSGVQALVRLPMLQRERDRAAGPQHRGLHLRLPRLAARHVRPHAVAREDPSCNRRTSPSFPA